MSTPRRIAAAHASPPFFYELAADQPANLMFAGSVLGSHGFVVPIFRLYGPGPQANIVAADLPGLADALGIWFPSFPALPFKFDPVLLSERIVDICRPRIAELRERVPDAERIELCLHGAFEVRADQADQLCRLIAAELPEIGPLTKADVRQGSAQFQRALEAADTTERVERLLHFYLAVWHHLLANDLDQLIVTDEEPCETTVLWSFDGQPPPTERAWSGSTLYKSVEDRDNPKAWWVPTSDDPDVTIEFASLMAGFVPWSPASQLRLARVFSRLEAPETTIIHATEALFLAELAEIPTDVRAELHALRAIAFDRVRGHHPRAEEHAARNIVQAYELGFRFDRETTLRWIERYSQ